jgi:hypothetical protein
MSAFPIENRAGLDPERFADLCTLLAGQRSFKTALDWALTRTPPLSLEDIHAQDEFSHDALISGLDGLWLVYDVT